MIIQRDGKDQPFIDGLKARTALNELGSKAERIATRIGRTHLKEGV